MIISRTQVQNLLRIYDKNIVTAHSAVAGLSKPVRKSDEVDISIISKLKQKIIVEMSASDPKREQKIERLTEQFDSGTYVIDYDKVSEKMLQRAIIDEIA